MKQSEDSNAPLTDRTAKLKAKLTRLSTRTGFYNKQPTPKEHKQAGDKKGLDAIAGTAQWMIWQ